MPLTPEEIAAAAAKAATATGTPSPEAPAAWLEAAAAAAPEITHKEPIVASGAAGPVVRKLVDLLAVAGHATNTIISGENPGGVLDNTVMSDVRAFQAANDITEDPSLEIAGNFVGPATWQALYDQAAKTLNL